MSAVTAERAEIAIPDIHPGSSAQSGAGGSGESRKRLGAENLSAVKRKNNLLVTVSAAAIVAVTAGAIFFVGSHRAHPLHTAGVSLTAPVALAPAASLARAPSPTPALPLPAIPAGGGDDMAQFLRDGGHSQAPWEATHVAVLTPPPTAAREALAPTANNPASLSPATATTSLAAGAGSQPVSPTGAQRGAAMSPSSMPTATAPAAASVAAPVTPTDAAGVAARLVPGKMTDQEQIQVLDLVTKLGTLVRDQNIRIGDLQSTVSTLQGRVDNSLSDFGRRLRLAEATGAVNGAAAVAVSVPVPGPVRNVERATSPTRLVVHPASRTIAAADTGAHRYHVQAASPGLAMLSELDASGGEEAQLPVAPGDSLPGYGRVISISQRGSAWVVKAQNGLIQ